MDARLERIDDTTEVVIHTVDARQVKAVMDNAAALRSVGHGNGSDMKLCMSVDGFVIQAWCDKHGVSWTDFMNDPDMTKRFVEDPDNAAFRIWEGRV